MSGQATSASVAIPQAGGGSGQTGGQTAAQPNGGGLIGVLPDLFDGDRSRAKAFWNSFMRYKRLNHSKDVMSEAYKRVVLCLSFFKGKKVEDWVENQMKLLDDNVAAGRPETSEQHWADFKAAFDLAYSDMGEKMATDRKLQELRMINGDIDTYTAMFKMLLKQAGYAETEQGALKMYKRGLPAPLNIEVVRNNDPSPANLSDWINAARKQQLKYLELQEFRGPKQLTQKQLALAKALGIKNPQYPQKKDPNAMDVDFGGTQQRPPYARLTDEEREKLRAEGRCFRCRQKGHNAKGCRGNAEYGRPAPTIKAQGDAPKEAPPKEPESKEKTLKGIMGALKDEGLRQDVFDMIVEEGFV